MFALASRDREAEWMDEPSLAPGLHRDALRGLSRINAVSRTVASVWSPLHEFIRQCGRRDLSVLDLACGGGDLAIGLASRAQRSGIALRTDACDISPVAISFAEERARRAALPVRFYLRDVLQGTLPQRYDAIVCSLFLHHLSSTEAIRLLECCASHVRGMLIVSDLDRTAAGLVLASVGTRLLSRSPVVHVDGLRSVRAAFTRGEVQRLAVHAGLTSPRFRTSVVRQWPCRWRLVAECTQ